MTTFLKIAAPCLLAAWPLAQVAGCGSDSSSPDGPPDAGDAPLFDASNAEVGPLLDAASEASSGCFSCSSDLHEVFDCHGGTTTCADDRACDPSSGQCVDPCDAARANKAAVGCDYYSVYPADLNASLCYAVAVANTWTTPLTIQVDFGGTAYDLADFARIPSGGGGAITYLPLPGGQLPPGEVAVLFLGDDDGGFHCPDGVTVPHHGPLAPELDKSFVGDTFHVRTDRPAMVYDFAPYNGSASYLSSAATLLATSSWDTNYVAVSPNGPGSAIQIVAPEDDTEITIAPTAALLGNSTGTIPSLPANQVGTFIIQKGQLLQLYFSGYDGLVLDGTVIQATKPIGAWMSGGLFVDTPKIDMAHQQIPPVKALGYEYVAVSYGPRTIGGPEEVPPWKIVGVVDGTTLTYDPARPDGAPESLNAGQSMTFHTGDPFVVRSQDPEHPLYMSGYMTGCDTVSDENEMPCPGDAEYVNVVPSADFLSRYVFTTDPSYPDTNVVVVRPKAPDGTFKDVMLDCAGVLANWQPVGQEGLYEFTRVDLVRGDYEAQGDCNTGPHEIHSDAPFGFTTWGWGDRTVFYESENTGYTSYAFTGPPFVRRHNGIVVPPVPK